MKKFKFTTKKDNEAIGMCEAQNIEEAMQIFANTKQLTIDSFITIYEVSEAIK